MAKKIGGLGKGLSAIFIENDTEDKNEVVTLKISQVEPNRRQPRRSFDDESLEELAESIRQHGVLQPILVRPQIFGGYQIVAGERRYRASRLAGLTEIPAIIRELSDSETMFGMSQEDVARTVGKSRPAVANMLRLLSLPDDIKPMLEEGQISAGHARALLSIEDEKAMTAAAQKIADEKMSVREAEQLVKKLSADKPAPKAPKKKQPTIYKEVELTLEQELGTKVTVVPFNNKPGGTLCVEFYDPSELFKLTAKLTDLWNRQQEE